MISHLNISSTALLDWILNAKTWQGILFYDLPHITTITNNVVDLKSLIGSALNPYFKLCL